MTRYWKVTGPNGEAVHGGTFTYDLPKNGKPGKWTPRIKDIEACERGYHVCTDDQLLIWCYGARISLADVRGPQDVGDKVVCEQVRLVTPTPWDETTARLFAVECAADVEHLMADKRSLNALEVAYRYAVGDATETDRAAARDAAWAAAWDAERNVASDAARDAARYAAWDAARAAASDAALAAAGYAASAAARAARDAARDTEWYAARARQTARLLWWIGASKDYPE